MPITPAHALTRELRKHFTDSEREDILDAIDLAITDTQEAIHQYENLIDLQNDPSSNQSVADAYFYLKGLRAETKRKAELKRLFLKLNEVL